MDNVQKNVIDTEMKEHELFIVNTFKDHISVFAKIKIYIENKNIPWDNVKSFIKKHIQNTKLLEEVRDFYYKGFLFLDIVMRCTSLANFSAISNHNQMQNTKKKLKQLEKDLFLLLLKINFTKEVRDALYAIFEYIKTEIEPTLYLKKKKHKKNKPDITKKEITKIKKFINNINNNPSFKDPNNIQQFSFIDQYDYDLFMNKIISYEKKCKKMFFYLHCFKQTDYLLENIKFIQNEVKKNRSFKASIENNYELILDTLD